MLSADKSPNDWLTYHGSYQGWHHSALKEIDTSNVDKLRIAWIHTPGRATRGVQSMPLAADGVLYYSWSYSRVFALDGATGEIDWTYTPELDEDLSRGRRTRPTTAAWRWANGNLYVGTVDGRLIALDMKTGKPVWDTKLIRFAEADGRLHRRAALRQGQGHHRQPGRRMAGRGPIFGVNAATGEKKWEFITVGGTDEAMKTWGNETWRTGGGGGWMPGTFDAETNTVWWGTANPAPLYDWAGANWKTEGPRRRQSLHDVGHRARS